MDKIQKFLQKKLDKRYRQAVYDAINRILSGKLEGLDITTVKKHPGHYRARIGRVRIVFCIVDDEVHLLNIGYRDDNTYHDI